MSLSSCPQCWDTPCGCGFYWRNYQREGRISHAATVLGVTVAELKKATAEIIPEKHPLHDGDDQKERMRKYFRTVNEIADSKEETDDA